MNNGADKQQRDRESSSSGRGAYAGSPLVYACSGCSSVAQLANDLAVRLDREQLAEMSCIAGVGGSVRPLLKAAKSGRKILVFDGYPLHCAKRCLESHAISPTVHIDLSKAGIKKRFHADATCQETEYAWNELALPAARQLKPS